MVHQAYFREAQQHNPEVIEHICIGGNLSHTIHRCACGLEWSGANNNTIIPCNGEETPERRKRREELEALLEKLKGDATQ